MGLGRCLPVVKPVHFSRRPNLRRVRNLCCDLSFAPSGLCLCAIFPHGLRRGQHSCAAPRLRVCGFIPPLRRSSGAGLVNVPRMKVKAPQGLNSLLKNSFSDSLLPVTSFPDSAPVAGFPPVAEDRSVAELGIFQQTVKPGFLFIRIGTAGSRALPKTIFETCPIHGLRRGLHSCAAPRLEADDFVPSRLKAGFVPLWLIGFLGCP